MPPKAAAEGSLDPTASTLLLILSHQSDLQMNNAELAPILGIKDGKNVPRKIDSLIKPFGYKYEKGRFTAINGPNAASTTSEAGKKAKKVNNTGEVKEEGSEGDVKPKPAKKPAAKGKKRAATTDDSDAGAEKTGKKQKVVKKEETDGDETVDEDEE